MAPRRKVNRPFSRKRWRTLDVCPSRLANERVDALPELETADGSSITFQSHEESSERNQNGAKIGGKVASRKSAKKFGVSKPQTTTTESPHLAALVRVGILVDFAVHHIVKVVRQCSLSWCTDVSPNLFSVPTGSAAVQAQRMCQTKGESLSRSHWVDLCVDIDSQSEVIVLGRAVNPRHYEKNEVKVGR